MKTILASPLIRAALLTLPFLLLYVWFRNEQFFHSHRALLIGWVVVSFAATLLLKWTLRSGKGRAAILTLWIIISGLFLLDFVQLVFFWEYSEARFLNKLQESTEEVRVRAEQQLTECRTAVSRIEEELLEITDLNAESISIHLHRHLQMDDKFWAVYDQSGVLIAWRGQFASRETYIPQGSEEVLVANLLHQQFMKLKRAVRIRNKELLAVVLSPFAAEYDIENRYLSSYNLLTDGLAIVPDLLYNSRQSTTTSPELVIRTVQIAPDLAISALYKRQQFGEFLVARIFQLHWWLELIVLAFFLFSIVHLFFEFVRVSGDGSSKIELFSSWMALVVVSLFSSLTIAEFSSFGSSGLFQPQKSGLEAGTIFFRSPGSFLITSFLLLNVVFTLVILVRRMNTQIGGGLPVRALYLSGASVTVGVLLALYCRLLQKTLSISPFDPIDLSVLRLGGTKLSQIFGMLWLDLAFVLLISLVYAIALSNVRRTRASLGLVAAVQIIASVGFVSVVRYVGGIPIVPALLLYSGAALLVFCLPLIWPWFERINFVSRFLVLLIFFSVTSFLFYLIRFHYAAGLQRTFVEHEAAMQVIGHDEVTQSTLNSSEVDLEQAVENLSLDPKIADLAYRLWTRTELARNGYKSAVEIYDQEGRLLNRFSLALPRLTFSPERIAQNDGWSTVEFMTMLGSIRKRVLVAVRPLETIGYISVQTVQDYENLPFIATNNPFQELFRPQIDARLYVGSPYLNVYDAGWRPVYVSNAEFAIPARHAKSLLTNASTAWSREQYPDRLFNVYYFRMKSGYGALMVPAVGYRTHIVHFIDLALFHLTWFSLFGLIVILFFRPYLSMHLQPPTATRFNFFQKLLFAFFIFAIVPMLFLSLVIRNYVWDNKMEAVTSRALNSFSVATKVVSDYLSYRAEGQPPAPRGQLFSNELLEWISQVIQQDINLYYDRYLLAASNRDLFSAGLLGEQLQGQTYVDLFFRGQKHSITQMEIGDLAFLNVSGRIYTGRFKEEVVTLPFVIDRKIVEAEITGLREYTMLAGASLILFAAFLGYFLANRFSRPVQVLIRGTGEMSRGNLRYRIQEAYPDEFQQLVDSFNAMARSLDEKQEALERRRAYIENILNNITTAVISIDNTTHVTTVNPSARQMFGIDPDYRGSLSDLMDGDGEWSPVHSAIGKFLNNRESFQFREVSVSHGNEEKNFRLVYVPLFEESEWNGAVLLVEDISDIIRSNRLSAWAEMARRVAHEVKNPLTPIQLAVEHLVKVHEDRKENFDEVLHSCSEAVLRQVKTLRRLVSDFSQYGKPVVLNRTGVNLPGFLNDLVENYKEHLPSGIHMETQLGSDLPDLQIDADKMRGALMNIIENGLQAMNGNGSIVIQAMAADGKVTIRIKDSGRGIPPEIVPRLFEPYFSTKTGGTGLGLAIARKTIEDHGGKIAVESLPGSGTTVTIQLPAD